MAVIVLSCKPPMAVLSNNHGIETCCTVADHDQRDVHVHDVAIAYIVQREIMEKVEYKKSY